MRFRCSPKSRRKFDAFASEHDDTHAAIACDMLNPAQCPEHALMARIPLGLGPSLHQLRSRSLCLVRRLHSYYGLVRLPMPVHHRLRLLAFPMRTAVRESELSTDRQTWDIPGSDAIYLRVMWPWTRRDGNASHDGIAHVAFDHDDSLRSREFIISWLNHTPHATAVYASCSALPPPHATLASRRPASLTWAGLAPADRASFAWRLPLLDHLVGASNH